MEHHELMTDFDEFQDIDLFAEDMEERLSASASGCSSSVASGTSVSSAGSCWCSFSTVGSACTAAAVTEL